MIFVLIFLYTPFLHCYYISYYGWFAPRCNIKYNTPVSKWSSFWEIMCFSHKCRPATYRHTYITHRCLRDKYLRAKKGRKEILSLRNCAYSFTFLFFRRFSVWKHVLQSLCPLHWVLTLRIQAFKSDGSAHIGLHIFINRILHIDVRACSRA
jgi:hypothetical protein